MKTMIRMQAMWLTVFALMIVAHLPSLSASPGGQRFVTTQGMLKQVAVLLEEYVKEHDGRFPVQLTEIAEKPVNSELLAMLISPEPSDAESPSSWLYFYGWVQSDPAESIVVAAPFCSVVSDNGRVHRRRLVLRRDFSVDYVDESDFYKIVTDQLRRKMKRDR